MVIEYSIDYSLSLGNDVKTVVSTDIDEVITYCKVNGVDYIARDESLCGDNTKIEDVLADAIKKKGRGRTCCSLVYGNIPVRYPRMFHKAVRFLEDNIDYDAVISMQRVEKFHPDWMFPYNNGLLPKMEEVHYRRQSLSPKMIPDGHTLLFKIRKFVTKHKGIRPYRKEYRYSIFGDKIRSLTTDKLIIDIDTKKDLHLAEAFLQAKRSYKK